jgi:hypothetical protein
VGNTLVKTPRPLGRNLTALRATQPEVAARLGRVLPRRDFRIAWSRSGLPIPELVGADGASVALHSRYDPIREAHRLPQYAKDAAGFFTFLGMGAGYHVREFLDKSSTTGACVVEADAELARAVMEHVDLTAILGDARVQLVVGESAEDAASSLLHSYLPAVDGDLHTVNLASLTRFYADYFRRVIVELQRTLDRVAVDYTTQAAFGTRWFANILANLPRVEQTSRHARPVVADAEHAVVVGAGPSAELAAEQLRGSNATVVACDSALPILSRLSVTPDFVVSVDCQHVSYHHWLARNQVESLATATLLDVASPPIIGRRVLNPIFFAGNHPMTRYLSNRWLHLPTLPTAGGNVGYAAVAFAHSLGFRRVDVLGLDYAYPGKRYARGAALYTSMAAQQSRFEPQQQQDLRAIFRSRPTRRIDGGVVVYESQQMRNYRAALDELIASVTASEPQTSWQRPRAPTATWRQVLRELADDLQLLPAPRLPLRAYLQELDDAQRNLVTILLPGAAALHEREHHSATAGQSSASPLTRSSVALLERTRAWSLRLIERTIRHGDD